MNYEINGTYCNYPNLYNLDSSLQKSEDYTENSFIPIPGFDYNYKSKKDPNPSYRIFRVFKTNFFTLDEPSDFRSLFGTCEYQYKKFIIQLTVSRVQSSPNPKKNTINFIRIVDDFKQS